MTARDCLVLGGFLPPGHTLSTQCVGELVALIEATVGRPRRRGEMLTARLAALRTRVSAPDAQLAR
ncbi:MAG TPA: hypothetical protein VNL16_03170 [Chloroflexota bacterium]|nr:hypothetical protein [Chloroflexota bacterium]